MSAALITPHVKAYVYKMASNIEQRNYNRDCNLTAHTLDKGEVTKEAFCDENGG